MQLCSKTRNATGINSHKRSKAAGQDPADPAAVRCGRLVVLRRALVIGNTLAEYFNPTENNLDIAQMAVSMAPDDPLTHWRIAQVSQKVLPLDQQAQAIAEYEKAVSLSPNDYRFWMSLGTAYEQAGDPAKAEHALRRAVALAPSYAYPHWYLGNLLLQKWTLRRSVCRTANRR